MTEQSHEEIRSQAIANLDAAAKRLRLRLDVNDVDVIKFEPWLHGVKVKLGKGYLCVREKIPLGYPGVSFTSSMGANSGDSYSGFLPGVTFDEALLLVLKEHKKWTR